MQQNCQEEMQVMIPVEPQESAVMAQLVFSSIGYVANGGLGLLVIGGIVSFRFSFRIFLILYFAVILFNIIINKIKRI